MHVLRMHKSAWLLVLLSAGLQILVFPLPNLYFLCWAAIAPLLFYALQNNVGARPRPILRIDIFQHHEITELLRDLKRHQLAHL